jgi:hypothetical protein
VLESPRLVEGDGPYQNAKGYAACPSKEVEVYQAKCYRFSVIVELNTNSVLIGKPQYAFNGLIDEVRIYSRALSEEEIKELFQMGQVQ